MSLSDAITTQEKLGLLNALRGGFARDIIRYCLELGIDYDSFDYETYEAPETPTAHQQTLLATACNGLKLTEQKLQDLS